MNVFRQEGIVLQVVKYGEQDLVITVFSAEQGLLRMFVAGGLARKGKNRLPTEPLTQAEFVYTTGAAGGLLRCREISVQEQFRFLRESYVLLEAAGQLVEVILKSQWQERPVPAMYALFKMYLVNLKYFEDFQVAVSSLRLKILRHEGLFSLDDLSPEFDEEEQKLVLVLAHGRSLATLRQMVGVGDFHGKVQRWFRKVMND